MKTLLTVGILILLSNSLFADDEKRQNEILGAWELMDVTAVNVADSPPYGLPAIKHYYSADGKMFGLAANEKLTDKTDWAFYSISNNFRILKKPGSETIQTKIDFPDTNTLRYFFHDGQQVWTFRRMRGEDAFNSEIEPRSVVVLQTVDRSKQLTCLDVKYDTNNFSKLSLPEHCVGIWETVEYKGIPQTEMPPYGFPNDKLIFTKGGKFSKVAPAEMPTQWSKYEVNNSSITVWNVDGTHPEKFEKVRFDKWGRMILSFGENVELTLKLLQRDTTKVPVLPAKICLLELQQQ